MKTIWYIFLILLVIVVIWLVVKPQVPTHYYDQDAPKGYNEFQGQNPNPYSY